MGIGDCLDDREPEAQPGVAIAGPPVQSLERLEQRGHSCSWIHRAAVRHLELRVPSTCRCVSRSARPGCCAGWRCRSRCPPGVRAMSDRRPWPHRQLRADRQSALGDLDRPGVERVLGERSQVDVVMPVIQVLAAGQREQALETRSACPTAVRTSRPSPRIALVAGPAWPVRRRPPCPPRQAACAIRATRWRRIGVARRRRALGGPSSRRTSWPVQ